MANANENLKEIKKGSGEKGAASLLSVLVIFGVTFTVLGFVGLRTDNDLKKIRHQELQVSKQLVSRVLAFEADCSTTTFTCAANTYAALSDKDGELVIAGDSNGTQIGEWNVRLACVGPEYQVQIARLSTSSASGFMDDPLTKQPMAWKELVKNNSSLKQRCGRERQVRIDRNAYIS